MLQDVPDRVRAVAVAGAAQRVEGGRGAGRAIARARRAACACRRSSSAALAIMRSMAAGSSLMRSLMRPEATRGKERARSPSNPSDAHEAHRIHDPSRAPRGQRPPVPLRLHPGPVRRVLAIPEGRRAVHRRSPGRGGLPDGGGTRAAREHLVVDRRALLTGARLRGLPRAADGGARGVPARGRGGPGRRRRLGAAAVLARPERVRDRDRRRSRQRRGDGPQGLPHRRRGVRRGDLRVRARARGRHRPDGVLRELPAAPADAARRPGRHRRQPVAGGAEPPRADRRGHRRHRPLRRAPAPARRPRDEDRPPPQGARHRRHRRHAVRGRQALADPALLLLELAGVRALAHRAALDHPGARLRRLRPRHRASTPTASRPSA